MKALIVLSAHCEPLPTSAAAHMCDLSEYFAKSRRVYFITQTKFAFGKSTKYGKLFGIPNPFLKSENKYLRFLGELLSPIVLALIFGIYCRIFVRSYNIVAYSPTTLQSPLMWILKNSNSVQLLILRDIFPLWLVDANIIREKSLTFKILDRLSSFQYKLSDVIGVQSANDIELLDKRIRFKCKVLNSFYAISPTIKAAHQELDHKYIEIGCFGTFGPAQGWRLATEMINKVLLKHHNIRFNFYGSNNMELNKNLFVKEVRDQVLIKGPVIGEEFSRCLSNMDIGFFSLESKISGSNIPGKFVNYCNYSLPTFALCNVDSYVAELIRSNKLGYVADINNLVSAVAAFDDLIKNYDSIDKEHIFDYFVKNYSVTKAAETIDSWLIKQTIYI